METNQQSKCDLCGGKGLLEYVDTKDFRGFFCPTCRSMMEQTTRDDGSSRLHPSHKRMLQDQIKFNQRSNYPEQADWLLQGAIDNRLPLMMRWDDIKVMPMEKPGPCQIQIGGL